MTTNRAIRASDLDREHVVEILRRQYSEGRLTSDEFTDRTTAAYAARTWGDLLDLTADLPVLVRLDDGSHTAAEGYSPRSRRPGWALPIAVLLGVLLACAAVSGGAGYWHHGHHGGRFFPVLPLLILALLFARWITRWRRRGSHR